MTTGIMIFFLIGMASGLGVTLYGAYKSINCIWYEPHYRAGRGSVRQMIMTSHGTCLKDGSGRGALRRGCKGFETK